MALASWWRGGVPAHGAGAAVGLACGRITPLTTARRSILLLPVRRYALRRTVRLELRVHSGSGLAHYGRPCYSRRGL